MDGDGRHACSTTAFEPFPDSALERSLVDRFAEQVARHRDCVAVVDRGRTLSFGALDIWTNGIAHSIVERAGRGTDPVALIIRQGAGYAAAVLGTLKSGRPYVPLEPTDPTPRLRSFLAECDARVIVTDEESLALAAGTVESGHVIRVEAVAPRSAAPDVDLRPDAVAYIFLTSGSTGRPKGVYDTHRNVLHNILRYTNALEIAPADRLTLLQGPAFSGCVSSQFGALLNGAASYPFRLVDEGLVRAADWLRSEQITIYHSVPSIFRAIVAQGGEFPDVRVVRLEGDRATSEDFELWKRHFTPGCVLANGLGTTETGLARQLILRRADSPERGVLPVGYPVRDMTVHVVDGNRSPVPQGDVGEIAVASDHLALGYWKRPDLTSERFELRDGKRMYLTGDLGRLTSDGCLEYLGRGEGDLKILGVRVEPAEVERELLCVEGVLDAAVAVRPGPRGDGRLVAYIVPQSTGLFDLELLRATLATRLPAAMLPTGFVELERLPLAPNGKVDRRALPDVPEEALGNEEASVTPSERWLAAIWADVLGVTSVGADDDFFSLGGDSLAAAEIVARIEGESGRSLPVSALVRAPTVSQLDTLLEDGSQSRSSYPTVLRAGGDRPPLVLLHGITGNALHYSHLVGELDDGRPIWALECLDPGGNPEVDAVVATHAAELCNARPTGPYLLAGFCSGGVIASELGRRLAGEGHEVQLAILGITPLDFPTLVTPDAYERWRRTSGQPRGFPGRVRRHARAVRQLPAHEMPSYVAQRARNVLARRGGRRPRGGWEDPTLAMERAVSSHRSEPFPGRVLLVLHRDDTRQYTDAPQADWASLGTRGVEVVVLPGEDHAMLETGGVAALAAVLSSWAASATSRPR